MTILDEIFAYKFAEVQQRLAQRPLEAVQGQALNTSPPLDFVSALRRPLPDPLQRAGPALIAEVKQASPSRGVLRPDFNPLELARTYQQNGAAAISVLTDEHFFRGSLNQLRSIADDLDQRGCSMPLLRKDFIFHPYQVYEARMAGAAAVLLIAAWLRPEQLYALHALIVQLGMSPLVEVHNKRELEIALQCEPRLIGINNRDLRDFSVDLGTTIELRDLIPPQVCVISESGIHSRQDIEFLCHARVDAVLVGEALVTAPDIAGKVRELSGMGIGVAE
jgi:indole-3-glycerol phosphate synthase